MYEYFMNKQNYQQIKMQENVEIAKVEEPKYNLNLKIKY